MENLKGTVIRQHLGHYFVVIDDREWDCAISSRLRKQLEYPEASPGSRRRRVQRVLRTRVTDPVVIGDHVEIEPGDDYTGMIREVLPRRNKVSRKASGSGRKEQLLAANIDRIVPVFASADPTPDWNLLDRMLAIAEWQDLPATICLNKMDLDRNDVRATTAIYERAGYPVVHTSTVTDLGEPEFREVLRTGTVLFVGPSGVGKSSLLNWLQPGLQLRTGEVSHVMGDGRHTTTHLELVSLDGGGLVGDIPGVKEFRLWDIESSDIPELFREFRPYKGRCKFSDCVHDHEPDCAVKQAVKDDEISQLRYDSYLRLKEDP